MLSEARYATLLLCVDDAAGWIDTFIWEMYFSLIGFINILASLPISG